MVLRPEASHGMLLRSGQAKDGARMDGRTTTYFHGTGNLLKIVISDQGVDEAPLLIGEVHGLVEKLIR